jgi:serine/threonine protein kinase
MSASQAARHLLYGMLALQNSFIDRHALVAAFDRWTTEKGRSLGEILLDAKQLSLDEHLLLEGLVGKHLARHEHDVERSLAALSGVGSAAVSLRGVNDPDVQASMQYLAVAEADPNATIEPLQESSPSSATRFKKLRPHAKGGLGEIFVAEDQELHREVALKEIHHAQADDDHSRTQFLLEAEITGGLEHPGIVPVYGLGTYADGRPYYAMRFIKGSSLQDAIRAYYAKHDRDTIEFQKLLRRFLDVCNAIQYAHDRGVLHRDLKPGNIMLGKYGETMVVDWGLAKVTGQTESTREDAERPLRPSSGSTVAATQQGSLKGTPGYMSPEQAAGELERLGVVSDVYSLGATLYHLLTGQNAFPGKSYPEVLQKVRTGDFSHPRQVRQDISRPLEAVCLKAMALEPENRYPSVQCLAAEIERWLADQPVLAFREPITARARRWVRKRPGLTGSFLAAVAVGLVGLAAGIVIVSAKNHELSIANKNEKQARRAESQAKVTAQTNEQLAKEQKVEADRQRTSAEKRLAQVEKGVDILGSIFTDLDPNAPEKEGRPLQAILGERLDLAVAQLEGEALGDPLATAKLQLILGKSLLGLGYAEKGVTLFAKSRATFESALGADEPDTLTSMYHLAQAYGAAGKRELALPLYQETFKLRTSKLGPDHPDTLASMHSLALGLQNEGKLSEALSLFEKTLELRNARLGIDHSDTLLTMNDLAVCFKDAGKLERALSLLTETVRLKTSSFGRDDVSTLTSMGSLAEAYRVSGQLDKALPLYIETLQRQTSKLGRDHPHTLTSLNNLGLSYRADGKHDLALDLFKDTLERQKVRLGEDHPFTLTVTNNIAELYRSLGKLDVALPLYEETLKLRKRRLGPSHHDTLASLNGLAGAYYSAGSLDLAVPLFEEAIALQKATLGPEHNDTLISMNNLGATYKALGKLQLAQTLGEESLKLSRGRLGIDHPTTLTTMGNLASIYHDAKDLDRALPLYEETLERHVAKFGSEHPDTLNAMNNLALGYRDAQQPERALSLLKLAVAGLEKRQLMDGFAGQVVLNLADCHERLNQFDQAEVWRRRWSEEVKKRSGKDSALYANQLATLSVNLVQQQKYAAAESALRECLAIREKNQPDAWPTFNTRSMLGGVLVAQKKYDEAELLLLSGYEGLKHREQQIPAVAKARLPDAIRRLVELYTAWEKADQSQKWQSKLKE